MLFETVVKHAKILYNRDGLFTIMPRAYAPQDFTGDEAVQLLNLINEPSAPQDIPWQQGGDSICQPPVIEPVIEHIQSEPEPGAQPPLGDEQKAPLTDETARWLLASNHRSADTRKTFPGSPETLAGLDPRCEQPASAPIDRAEEIAVSNQTLETIISGLDEGQRI